MACNLFSIFEIKFTMRTNRNKQSAIDDIIQFLTLLLLLIPFISIAQTGPGGIQSSVSNRFHFEPGSLTLINNGASLSLWDNIGGNVINATQTSATKQPQVLHSTQNLINGNPVVQFDGVDDLLEITSNSDINLGNSYSKSFAVVLKTGIDCNSRQVVYEEGGKARGLNIYISGNKIYVGGWNVTNDGQASPWGFGSVSANVNSNTTYILSIIMNGNVNKTGSIKVFINGNHIGDISSVGLLYQHIGLIGLGASNNGTYFENGPSTGHGQYYCGDIAEFIHFNTHISEVERIILENHLAAKYGCTLINNDFYTRDNANLGDFDFHVTGIGKFSDGSEHKESRGSGIVTISHPSPLQNDKYLFWGQKQKNSNYSFLTSDLFTEKLNMLWRVSKRNNLGTITLSVPASELDLTQKPSCTALNLIVSSDSSFSTKVTYPLSLSSGIYTASNISLNDGDYFTFEYISEIVISGTTNYNGSGINNAPSINDACYSLRVTSNTIAQLNEDANVKAVQIDSSAELSLTTSHFLCIKNEIINNGIINVEEHSSLIQQHVGLNTNSGSGYYSIARTGNNFNHIYNIWSSPVSNANITTVFNSTNPCDIFCFDNINQTWSYDYSPGFSTTCNGSSVTFSSNNVISGGDGVMDIGVGYFITGNNSPQRTFIGATNNGDYESYVHTTNLGNPGGTDWADDDWNLLGNPYPSGLSADSFWKENAILNQRITDALYFWDEADSSGGYNQHSDYASWNLSGGVESGNSNKQPLGNIASGQGFWVVAKNNSHVKFSNAMRVSANNQFFKRTKDQQHNAWFRFTSPSGYKNNILVGYNSHSTDGIDDGYDAHKLVGNGHVRFASIINQDEFVIQSMAKLEVAESKIIPLVVFTDELGVHSFSNYQKQFMPNAIKIYLVDLVNGTKHDLSNGEYTVNLLANTTYDNRFQLEFQNTITVNNNGSGSKDLGNPSNTDSSNTTTTLPETLKSNGFNLFQFSNALELTNSNGFSGNLQILDITGKEVWLKRNIENSVSEFISIQQLTGGTYILLITQNNAKVITQKFIVP